MKREQGWNDFCIAGWNVGGSIERKLNDQEVCHRLRRYDFIFIAETHTKREWRLDLMDDFSFFRKDRLGGKAGGVAWFSRKTHAGLVREYSTNIPGVLVLEVDFTRKGSFRMFLVGVYFPPAGPTSSSRVAQQERADISHELPLLLARLKQLGVILLVGDTNASQGWQFM